MSRKGFHDKQIWIRLTDSMNAFDYKVSYNWS